MPAGSSRAGRAFGRAAPPRPPRRPAGSDPALVPGWETWEHRLGHHDELTDIASLGELLVALGGGLDLAPRDDLERSPPTAGTCSRSRPDLHPVVAQVATRMIEPDRHRRAQDLRSLIERLETYRDQPVDFDLERVAAGARSGDAGDRS